MTDEKQVPGTPGSGTPGKPDGGAPKAPDLEALRAKLGFKPTPSSAATPSTPAGPGAPAGTPAAPKPSLSGLPGATPAQAPKQEKVHGTQQFRFSGVEASSMGQKALSEKELAELDESLAKAGKPLGTKLILGGVVLLIVIAAVWIGLQIGKGMSYRILANEGISQAEMVKTYFTKGQTDAQGKEMAIRGEAAAKMKASLDEYIANNQDILTLLSEASETGRLPEGVDWEDVKKSKLKPLQTILTTYLESAPVYQANEILGGQVYAPDLAAEVSGFVGRANSLRASVEQLALTVEMLMGVNPPKPVPAAGEMPGKTAYVFAPNVDRDGAKILEGKLVKVSGEIKDDVLVDAKTKKRVEKEEKCVKDPLVFKWTCPSCNPKVPAEEQSQELESYVPQVVERTVEDPVAEITTVANNKKGEIEVKHLYAVDMRHFVKPLVERLQVMETRALEDEAMLQGSISSMLAVFFARLEDVQTKVGAVDLKRLMDLLETTAAQEQQFVL